MSQEETQLLAVELKPRPVPRDVVRALPMRLASAETNPGPSVPAEANPGQSVPAETKLPPAPRETIKPLTPQLRRLSVTVSAEFMAELEQARAALSHRFPDGDFERVVREGFKLLLERDRKRKGLTDRPREQPVERGADDRYVPAAVERAVWERDRGSCIWPKALRLDAPARVRPRPRSRPGRRTDDRQHSPALQEPQSHEGREPSRPGAHGKVPRRLFPSAALNRAEMTHQLQVALRHVAASLCEPSTQRSILCGPYFTLRARPVRPA